jgi:3-oxoacyl-(acyl-carrier-protein) synthase
VQEAIYSLLMLNNGFACESAHIEELDPAFEDHADPAQARGSRIELCAQQFVRLRRHQRHLAFTRVAA